ncbi:MAG: FAD-dependent oxidoreductase [Myxococcota bacterium]
MTSNYDVAVVGAGIVGAACAERLVQRGLSVVIVDRASPAGGATAAGMGHLVVMDGSEAQLELTAMSRRLWAERVGQLPTEVEHERCGTLWVAADDEEMAEAEAKRQAYEDHGVPAEILDAAALAEAEPLLRDGLAGALRVPDDAVLYQPNATRWMLQNAVDGGATLHTHAPVRCVGDGRVERADGSTIHAEHVVVAAGAHSAAMLETRDFDEAIRPRKGHLAITDRAPGTCHHQLVELGYIKSAHGNDAESVAFNLQPRRTGQILVGSSRQYGVDHDRVEPEMIGRMLARALEFMPALADIAVLRTWSGFRPATDDGMPLIGALPDDTRTLLAAGHEGLGITTSLGTAALVEAMVMGEAPPMSVAPFAPSRVLEGMAHG